MIPKDLMTKLTKKEAKVLAVACALKAGLHGGKNSVGSVVIHDAGRPWLSLTVASGVTAVQRLEGKVADLARGLAETRMCRYCGCSEFLACPGGCLWIADRVCSDPRCVEKYEEEKAQKASRKGSSPKAAKRKSATKRRTG